MVCLDYVSLFVIAYFDPNKFQVLKPARDQADINFFNQYPSTIPEYSSSSLA